MPSDRPGMTALALSRTRALRDMAILLATFLAFWKEEVLSLILLRSVISPTASSSLHITLLGSPSGKKQKKQQKNSICIIGCTSTYQMWFVYVVMHAYTMYAHICSLATLQCLVDRTSICTMFMPYQMYVHYNLRVQHWNLTYMYVYALLVSTELMPTCTVHKSSTHNVTNECSARCTYIRTYMHM